MRKKSALILVAIMIAVLMTALVACNLIEQEPQAPPPDVIDPGTPDLPIERAQGLKFIFHKSNSVFNAIFVDEFSLNDVEFSVVYVNSAGIVVKEENMGVLTQDMIREEDIPLLSTAGHHMIHVSYTLDGLTLTGSFALHLKNRSSMSMADVSFDLHYTYSDSSGERTVNATAFFGNTTTAEGKNTATVKVEKGYTFADWDEFTSTFFMSLSGMALVSVKDGDVVLSETQGFPYTIKGGEKFTTNWTRDVVNITFDLGLPDNATWMKDVSGNPVDANGKPLLDESGSHIDPVSLFNKKWKTQAVRKNTGRIIKPDTDEFNCFNGLYFIGWYDEANQLYNFNQTVYDADITLTAKWQQRSYSFTIYTMGGVFADDIADAVDETTRQTITQQNAESLGYILIDSSTFFAVSTGVLGRVTFSGFTFNVNYDKYVARVQVTPATETTPAEYRMLKFSDFYRVGSGAKIFEKGGEYLVPDGIYHEYECTSPVTGDTVEADVASYIKWKLRSTSGSPTYVDDISHFYTDVLTPTAKAAYTIKADGSVRIDKVYDEYVNAIEVPAEIMIDGELRPVTEIGDNSCINLKGLTSVDLSHATNLTRIGTRAFDYCLALTTVTVDNDNCAITFVGANAFDHTPFEDRYQQNDSADFIIFNKTLYKYAGDKEVVEIDLSNHYTEENHHELDEQGRSTRNARLAAIENISEGAFSDCSALETLTLSKNVKRIEDYVFSGLEFLSALIVPEDSSLEYIGANAFDNCDSFLTASNTYNYDRTTNAIYIGSIYYRRISRSGGTSDTVAASRSYLDGKNFDITMIAPEAFKGSTALANITFEDASKIKEIGRDALLTTAYIQTPQGDPAEDLAYVTEDGFTVINGILAAYYSMTADSAHIVIPDGVTSIAENAFNSYSALVQSVQFGGNVQKIGDYAFYGAKNLKTLIFTAIESDGEALSHAPEIAPNAFADPSGMLIDGARFFFRGEVMDFFTSADGEGLSGATQNWYDMYRLNTASFLKEDVQSVYIDKQIVEQRLFKTGERENALLDYYKDGRIENALIVASNTGVARREALDFEYNEVSLVPVGEASGALAKYIVKFKFNGSEQGVPTQIDQPNVFVLYEYKTFKAAADKHIIDFYDSRVYPDNVRPVTNPLNDLTRANNYWFTGLEGVMSNDDGDPVYWTSSDVNKVLSGVTFHYLDFEGGEHTIAYGGSTTDVDSLSERGAIISSGFSNTSGRDRRAYFRVYLYGLGTLRFELDYDVEIPRITSISQEREISIPINGSSEVYFGQHNIVANKQDGNADRYSISRSTFNIVSVDGVPGTNPVTNVLGMHTVEVNLRNADTNYVTLTTTLVYTVVLEDDSSLFDYEFKLYPSGKVEVDGISYDGEAYIISTRAPRTANTIVIPGKVEVDGKVYRVTQIGRTSGGGSAGVSGVFENYTALKEVYLSSNLTMIANRTFAGCTALEHVYTARQSVTEDSDLVKDTHYTLLSDKAVLETDALGVTRYIKEAKLTSLTGLEYNIIYKEGSPDEIDRYGLVISAYYDTGEREGDEIVWAKIVDVAEELTLPEREDTSEVYCYLPDTIYKTAAFTVKYANGNSASPVYYAATTNYRLTVFNRFNSRLEYIGSCAFENCLLLKEVDFSSSQNLDYIGPRAFAYTGLVNVDLSLTKIKSIDNSLFAACGSLKTVVVPSSVTAIGDSAFNNCFNLESVTGYGDLVYVGKEAFNLCTSLTEITLPESLSINGGVVGSSAFADCKALVIICNFKQPSTANGVPTGWHELWNSEYCPVVYSQRYVEGSYQENTYNVASDGKIYYVDESGLRYIVDLAAVTASMPIQKSSISGAVVIPETITYLDVVYNVSAINESAFEGNLGITSVEVLGTQLRSIARRAFADCKSLRSFVFRGYDDDHNGLTSLHLEAFSGCDSLTTPPVLHNHIYVDPTSNIAYVANIANMTATVTRQNVLHDTVTIPETVTFHDGEHAGTFDVVGIDMEAFSDNAELTSVTILGSKLRTIGSRAFANCTSLTTFTFRNNNVLTSIADDAFENCEQLSNRPAQNFVVESGVIYKLNGSTASVVGLQGQVSSIVIMPTVSLGEKTYTVDTIAASAFSGNTDIVSVAVYGDNLKTIESKAFAGCTNLSSFTFAGEGSNHLQTVAPDAFDNCHADLVKPTPAA